MFQYKCTTFCLYPFLLVVNDREQIYLDEIPQVYVQKINKSKPSIDKVNYIHFIYIVDNELNCSNFNVKLFLVSRHFGNQLVNAWISFRAGHFDVDN